MCGIAGFIGSKKLDISVIKKTLMLMKNRGPDQQDFFYTEASNAFLYLLSSRLSIIDLKKKSNQPFKINNYILVYNGEIYNYLELRKKLINKGIKLFTDSDTEVLLNYFILYKEECVKYFEGMWSFAIYDIRTCSIFFARDRFGEKPFFYLKINKDFYFGSETKFIQSLYKGDIKVNYNHLLDYLSLGYKSLYKKKENFFCNIHELDPGHYIYCNINKEFKPKKYWNLNYCENLDLSIEDAIENIKIKTIKAIDLRLRADVPIALCLSGGIDSAVIASVSTKILNKKIKTFSIINEEDHRYNEKENILATINDLKCDYELIDIKKNKNDNFYKLIDLINYHNAPISTISYFLQSSMLEKMSKQNFRVSLLGTAADEIFAGYYDHHLLFLESIKNENNFNFEKKLFIKFVQKNIRNPLLKDPEKYIKNPKDREHIYDEYAKIKKFIKIDRKIKFSEKRYCNNLLRNRMLNELFCETTPVILNEDDLNSMYYSIENRSPFLDSDLVKFAYTIPSKYLIHEASSKYLLRSAFKGVLNGKIRNNKKKVGFNSSVDSNFYLQDKTVKDYLFNSSGSKIFDILKKDKVKKLYDKKKKNNYESKFIFNFINAKIFLDKNK
jgi:asparagine synthase (glutamine-hydrolysing)